MLNESFIITLTCLCKIRSVKYSVDLVLVDTYMQIYINDKENHIDEYRLTGPTVLSTSFRKSFFAWRFTQKK